MPFKLRPHKLQSELYRCQARFPVVWAGRGSGKTEICRRKIVRALGMHYPEPFKRGDVPRFFYGLPTYNQARRVAWDALKTLVPKEWYEKSSSGRTFYESESKIITKYGTELHLVGLDAPQRIEGNQWCGGVLDESSDHRPKVFDLSIRPALTAYKGWCIRAGVPKRFGIGAEEFKAACDLALSGVDPDIVPFTWASETVLDAEELETIMATLSEKDFNEQYRATWEQVSGAIFYNFDPLVHISDRIAQYNSSDRVYVGSDFNVDPMCWVLSHIVDGKLRVFDELCIRNTNTEETLTHLADKYPDHTAGWTFFGDASANSRKTSASKSDYIQIYNDERFVNKEVYYFKSNPAIADRFAACNAVFRNAQKLNRFFVNSRCSRLIADLKHRSYKLGSKEPNDSGDMGHMSDAFGYIVSRLFPLTVDMGSASGGVLQRSA